MRQDPLDHLRTADTADFKTFWKWAMDRSKGIHAASTLTGYWRILNMHMRNTVDRDLEENKRRDIYNIRISFTRPITALG